jgi:hypothetical protein
MDSVSGPRLSSERATLVEQQVRARAESMRPKGTPVGICRICSTVVYGGDKLVLTAGSPLHAGCAHQAETL